MHRISKELITTKKNLPKGRSKNSFFIASQIPFFGILNKVIFGFGLIFFFLATSCKTLPKMNDDSNGLNLAQKKILFRDYDGARIILSGIYEKSNLKTEKGEALYWIAYTHIKESSYQKARNYLETADKLYRAGHLLGEISARIIACALLDGDTDRANKQYTWIKEKSVGEMAEIDFILGNYYHKKGELNQAKTYFQRCKSSGDNFFARKAASLIALIGEGIFYLQVGQFSNINNVNKLMLKLKKEYNLEPYIIETKSNNIPLYTICVGKFNTREEANNELRNYKNRFPDLALIIRP